MNPRATARGTEAIVVRLPCANPQRLCLAWRTADLLAQNFRGRTTWPKRTLKHRWAQVERPINGPIRKAPIRTERAISLPIKAFVSRITKIRYARECAARPCLKISCYGRKYFILTTNAFQNASCTL